MSAARDRLAEGYYNSQPKTPDNPGGMDNGGHVTNFPLALDDLAEVFDETVANNTATQAAIEADNNATEAAIQASNEATVTTVTGLRDATTAARDVTTGARDVTTGARDVAVAASSDAKRTVANNFPDRLDATGSWFTEALAGDPGAVANPTLAAISNVVGYGYEYTKANAQGQLFTKGVVTASSGKVYEIEAEVEWTVKGGAETPSLSVGVQGLDAAWANAGGQVQAPLQAVGAIGVQTIKYRFGYAAPAGGAAWPSPGASVWLRPYVLFNRRHDNSGPVTASTARVRRLTVRDVTAVVAAEIKAAEAAASAASVTIATIPQAQAGAGVGLMNAPLVAEAIAYQANPVGGVVRSLVTPSSRFLACDGATYLKATYPTLGALLGDRYAAWAITTPTVRAGYVFKGVYAETGLAIAIGTNGTLHTSADANTWTQQTSLIANFLEGRGAIKLAAKYFAYGTSNPSTGRALVSSANGTTGWADVTAFGNFANTTGGIVAMAYGVVNGVATVVAVGGNQGGDTLQIRWSTNEGGAWTDGTPPWTSGLADLDKVKVLIANGVLAVWSGSPAYFYRGTSPAALGAVSGAGAAPISVDVGNGLFVLVLASGLIVTSTDLVTFVQRDAPPGLSGFVAYLGYVNGAHHFRSLVGGEHQIYATPDFLTWYRVQMPQSVGTLIGQFRALGSKLLARSPSSDVVALAAFVHNPATEFPVPAIPGDIPSFIKAT